MSELVKLSRNASRTYGRGLFLRAIETETVISNVVVGADGHFIVETEDWHDYWTPVASIDSAEVLDALDGLHESWQKHIRSGFASDCRRELCRKYFILLDQLTAERMSKPECELRRLALACVLGFECFGIAQAGAGELPLAAGTTTVRNPIYLLAKLRSPDAIENPQFLPLVTVSETSSGPLFYHYRQHKLSADSPASLLFFLAANRDYRRESFHVINSLEHSIGQGADPRADERAQRISQKVLMPYLAAREESESGERETSAGFELVDLGSGSGILAAEICKEIRRFQTGKGETSALRVYLIDLSLTDPSRFFSGARLRSMMDCVSSIGIDYQAWLSGNSGLSNTCGVRVALLSRFLNNLSDFTITSIPSEALFSDCNASDGQESWRDCLPSRCLGSDSAAAKYLRVSSSRLELDSGRSFTQPSLSPYFYGLSLLERPRRGDCEASTGTGHVYLPLRRFQPECLMTPDGADSILEKLLEDCSLVIIQDADLRPTDILAHREFIKSRDVLALDMTKALGLRGHYSYALLREDDRALHALEGTRLW